MKINRSNFWNKLELISLIGMLLVGFLQICSLTFGKKIISYCLWPTLIIGFTVCLHNLITIKKFKKDKLLGFLLLFILTYVISIFFNFSYGYYDNLRTLVWFTMLVFIAYLNNSMHDDKSKNLYTIILVYLLGVFILNIFSFYTMLSGTWSFVLPEVSQTAPVYYLGFVWGRLYGVYWDANIGATMCAICIILSLELIIKSNKKWMQLFAVISIILSFFYIVFSDSRTGLLGLVAGLFFWFLLRVFKSKSVIVNLCKVFSIVVIIIGANFGFKSLFNYLQEQGITHIEVHTVEDNTFTNYDINQNLNGVATEDKQTKSNQANVESSKVTTEQQPKENEKKDQANNVGRSDEYKSDVSNRRFDIWKSAIEIFKTKPLFGITHNNVIKYTKENLPNTYIINNNHQEFDSMHNTFLDILVSQGLFGELAYILIVGFIIIKMIMNRKLIFDNANEFCTPIAVFFCMMAVSCVMTEIVYVTSPMATMLWLYIRKFMEEIKNAENS